MNFVIFCYFDLSVLEGYFGDFAHCYVDLKLLRLCLEEKQDTFYFYVQFYDQSLCFYEFLENEDHSTAEAIEDQSDPITVVMTFTYLFIVIVFTLNMSG